MERSAVSLALAAFFTLALALAAVPALARDAGLEKCFGGALNGQAADRC
jgi:uncharacterized membrane protein